MPRTQVLRRVLERGGFRRLRLFFVLFLLPVTACLNAQSPISADSLSSRISAWSSANRFHQEENVSTPERWRQIDDSLLRARSVLVDLAYDHILTEGLPTRPDVLIKSDPAMIRLSEEYNKLPVTDTLGRQRLMAAMLETNKPFFRDLRNHYRLLSFLRYDEDFNRRCAMIPVLRLAYETDKLDLSPLVTYLLRTYELKEGGEALTFPPGTSTYNKFETLTQELSGCWQ